MAVGKPGPDLALVPVGDAMYCVVLRCVAAHRILCACWELGGTA